jgi:hypothetical protein
MRALRIVVSDAVRPRVGAAVDVLASAESDAFNSGFDSGFDTSLDTSSTLSPDVSSEVSPSAAIVVAHGVLVLGVDAARGADGAPDRGVTLLVTPLQARELVFATTHAVVTLSLVPPEESH